MSAGHTLTHFVLWCEGNSLLFFVPSMGQIPWQPTVQELRWALYAIAILTSDNVGSSFFKPQRGT
ncbi:MAG: hypothetical protein WBF90_05635 [Rivularia sp. (in: cyanobacteria)]